MMVKLASLLENKKALTILLIFTLVCFGFYIIGVEQFNGLYGQDSHAYLKYARELQELILHDQKTNDFHWPIFYPLLGAVIGLSGLSSSVVMLGISFLSFLGVLLLINKIILVLYSKDGTLFLILGAATQVYFLRGGFLVMSDMLSCFFILFVVFKFIQWQKNKWLIYFLQILLFSFFAFFSRYPSVIIIAPIFVCVFWHYFIRWNTIYQIVFGLLIVLGSMIVVIYNNHFFAESLHLFDNWKLSNWINFSLSGKDGTHINTVPNILYVFGNLFHIGFLSFGILLIPFYEKMNMNRIVLVGLLMYIFLLIGLGTQNYRFLLIIHPIVLIFLFPAFMGFWEWLKKMKLTVLFVVGTLIFNGCFFTYSFSKTLKVYGVEREVVQGIKELNENTVVYSFYVDQSFPSYGLTNEIRNFYYKDYNNFESGALVVFNEAQFEDQWKNHRVMNNWNRLKANYHLDTLVKFQSNWRIYRIK